MVTQPCIKLTARFSTQVVYAPCLQSPAPEAIFQIALGYSHRKNHTSRTQPCPSPCCQGPRATCVNSLQVQFLSCSKNEVFSPRKPDRNIYIVNSEAQKKIKLQQGGGKKRIKCSYLSNNYSVKHDELLPFLIKHFYSILFTINSP